MEGTGEGVLILLFSEVTLFKYNVSTILSPIATSSNPALIESTPGEIVLQRNRIFKMLTTLNIHLCQ